MSPTAKAMGHPSIEQRRSTRCVRQSDRLISLPLKAAHAVQLAAWELRTQRCPRLAAVELGEDPGWTSPSTREHVSGANPDGILHVRRRREPDPGVWDRRLACQLHLGRRESADLRPERRPELASLRRQEGRVRVRFSRSPGGEEGVHAQRDIVERERLSAVRLVRLAAGPGPGGWRGRPAREHDPPQAHLGARLGWPIWGIGLRPVN